MEGDDGKAAARCKHLFGGRQPALELAQFLVDVDPDRLEGAGRRVLLHSRMMAGRLADDLRQLGRPFDRAAGDDRPGDPPRLPLLAIMEDDVGDLRLAGLVDEVGCALPLLGHPHVERPVPLEGEAPFGLVELHRGDADIERDAVDLVDAVQGKRLTHPGKTLRNKRQAPPVRSRQSLALSDRVGIAIEGDDSGSSLIENGLGVAAGAERAVDMGFAGGDGERFEHFVEKDRHVRAGGGRAHSFSPFSSR